MKSVKSAVEICIRGPLDLWLSTLSTMTMELQAVLNYGGLSQGCYVPEEFYSLCDLLSPQKQRNPDIKLMNGTTSDSDTDVKAEDKSGESEEAPKSEPVKIPILKTEEQSSSETVPPNK